MAAVRAPVVPTSLPTLHLYRQLLREAGYLPPALSPHISAQIRSRFHQHIHDRDTHLQKRLSRARNALRVVRAANHGEPDSMTSLIAKAFGRRSTRRRELMASFVQHPEQPVDSQALNVLLDQSIDRLDPTKPGTDNNSRNGRGREGGKFPFMDKWDKNKLRRLLISQQAQEKELAAAGLYKASIKNVNENANVPKMNSWGRELQPERVRSRQARWWKRSSNKIQPPLGKGEWDLLKRLSEGAQAREEAWRTPARRVVARPLSKEAVADPEDMELDRYASEPTAQIENRKVSQWRRYYGASDPNPFGTRPRDTQQRSDRWFRRAYQKGWHLTPRMDQNPNTLAYSFTWGAPKSQTIAPTQRQMPMFEGVDAKGRKKASKE